MLLRLACSIWWWPRIRSILSLLDMCCLLVAHRSGVTCITHMCISLLCPPASPEPNAPTSAGIANATAVFDPSCSNGSAGGHTEIMYDMTPLSSILTEWAAYQLQSSPIRMVTTIPFPFLSQRRESIERVNVALSGPYPQEADDSERSGCHPIVAGQVYGLQLVGFNCPTGFPTFFFLLLLLWKIVSKTG